MNEIDNYIKEYTMEKRLEMKPPVEVRYAEELAALAAGDAGIYDTIKKENLYPLGKVPARYFSEIILQLTKATASSQEQLSYPECKE